MPTRFHTYVIQFELYSIFPTQVCIVEVFFVSNNEVLTISLSFRVVLIILVFQKVKPLHLYVVSHKRITKAELKILSFQSPIQMTSPIDSMHLSFNFVKC